MTEAPPPQPIKKRRQRKPRRPPPTNLTGVVDEIAHRTENDPTPESLTLGEILDAVGRRTYGPMLLVIGLFAISPATVVPGLTWLAAGLTLIVAGQMALGMKRIWLPRAALNATLPREQVRKGLKAALPWTRRVDVLLKPRLAFLTAIPFVNLVGVLCVAAALLTFPLGFIPFAPLAPGAAVVFFALGITARDGLWILLGIAASAGAAWLARPLFFEALEALKLL